MAGRTAALRRLALLTLVTVVGFAAVQLPAAAAPAAATVALPTGDSPGSGRAPAAVSRAKAAKRAANAKTRIGISSGGTLPWASDADLARELDGYRTIGAAWLRFDLHWSVVERAGKGRYDWSLYDRLVAQATARGLRPLAILTYTPRWARMPACADSDKCAPAKADDFADFAEAAVRRYASRGVRHFELWNEPNIPSFWLPAPSATRYASLMRASYPRMKAVDKGITVLAGSTSPASDAGADIDPRTFLRQVYASGAGDSFDAWSHHPYYGPNRPGEAYDWSAWYQMYGTNPSLRSLMVANGDASKKIWATETGALVGVSWSCCGTTTEAAQAQLLREALDLWLSYPWAGGFMYYNYRGHQGWSLTRDDWSPRPAWFAYRDYVARG